MSPGIEVSLLVQSNGRWSEVLGAGMDGWWPTTGSLKGLAAGGSWHRTEREEDGKGKPPHEWKDACLFSG